MAILITFADGDDPETVRKMGYFIANNLDRDRQMRRRPRGLLRRLRDAVKPDAPFFEHEVGVAFRYLVFGPEAEFDDVVILGRDFGTFVCITAIPGMIFPAVPQQFGQLMCKFFFGSRDNVVVLGGARPLDAGLINLRLTPGRKGLRVPYVGHLSTPVIEGTGGCSRPAFMRASSPLAGGC